VSDLINHPEFFGGGGGIAASDHRDGTEGGDGGDGLGHGAGATGEGVEFEDSGRAVPDDGFGAFDDFGEE